MIASRLGPRLGPLVAGVAVLTCSCSHAPPATSDVEPGAIEGEAAARLTDAHSTGEHGPAPRDTTASGTFVFAAFEDMAWSLRVADRHGEEVTRIPFGGDEILLVGVSDDGHILYSDTARSNLVAIDDSGRVHSEWTADELARRLGYRWGYSGDPGADRADRLTPMRAFLHRDGRLELLVKCRIPERATTRDGAESETYRYDTILVHWDAGGRERWRSPGGRIVDFAPSPGGGTILAFDVGVLELDDDSRLVRQVSHPAGIRTISVSVDDDGRLLACLAIPDGAPGFDEAHVSPGKPGRIARVGELDWNGRWTWSFPHPCPESIQSIPGDRLLVGGG